MSDYQNIADQIRAFVTAADQTKTPELVDLAAAYASLCNETNARLRRCTDLIHRGLRAEATHLADEHPVLLEVVAALDLPEAAEWASVCATYELVRPPPLLMEAAQELNEAYALAQPAEALLYRLRRLALDRGPLTERIAVMRKLSKIDTTSMFWDQDIQTFETVRLKEIKVESARAIESNDGPALARLLAEVNAPDWRLPPNADLRARLVRAETSNRQAVWAGSRFRQRNFSERKMPRVNTMRTWRNISMNATLSTPSPMAWSAELFPTVTECSGSNTRLWSVTEILAARWSLRRAPSSVSIHVCRRTRPTTCKPITASKLRSSNRC
jgi:hypothetical protein